ncbi:mediator of DNA damage checkpoint protein 1 [Discoglossus pictus]
MDETQRLQVDSEDENVHEEPDKPVAYLHMFSGTYGPAQDFPIYWGENIIGRHSRCDITLPAQSVSKQHAVIEVQSGCHTLLDRGSLNKTRRFKAAITPHVRYALSHGDFLHFADVACQYKIEEVKEKRKEEEPQAVKEESDDDSILVPGTQNTLALEKTPGVAIRRMGLGRVLARDSGEEDEGDEEEGEKSWDKGDGGLGSSRAGCKVFSRPSDTFVPESDEETDISTSEPQFPSLNLRCDSDTDTQTPTRGANLASPSQDYVTTPTFSGFKVPLSRDTAGNERPISTDSKEKERNEPRNSENVSGMKEAEDKTKEQEVDSTSRNGNKTKDIEEAKVTLTINEEEQGKVDLHMDSDDKVNKTEVKLKDTPDIIFETDSDSEEDDATTSKNESKEISGVVLASGKHVEEADAKTLKGDQGKRGTNVLEKDQPLDVDVKNKGLVDIHLDSETDVEEGKASNVEVKKKESADIQLDSDTDVEEDKATNVEVEKKESVDIHLDSDTDVEEEDKAIHVGVKKKESVDMHLDSDTDVEEEDKAIHVGVKKKESVDMHLDSDTDVEEEDKAIHVGVKKESVDMHLDSDTDVEEDKATHVEVTKKESVDIHLDSDTDVEDDQGSNVEVKKEESVDMHLDSDTDVEEDKATNAEVKKNEEVEVHLDNETNVENSKTPNVVMKKKDKVEVHLDSDSDVEEYAEAAVKEMADADADVDTDLEEDAAGISKPSVNRKKAARSNLDSHKDVEEIKPSCSKMTAKKSETSGIALDSDTDVEDDTMSDVMKMVDPGIQLDSDSDVEDSKTDAKRMESTRIQQDSDTDMDEDNIKPSKKLVSKKEAPAIDIDSDTDVEEDSNGEITPTDIQIKVASNASDEGDVEKKAPTAYHLDSDTDVEEEPEALSTESKNGISVEKTSIGKDSVEDTKSVEESSTGQTHLDSSSNVEEDHTEAPEVLGTNRVTDISKTEGKPTEISLDSDTDAEEEIKPTKADTEEERTVAGQGAGLVSAIPRQETAVIPAGEKTTRVEGPQITEGADLDMMATQCYLDPQDRESDVPDEEEATQAYMFSSTWHPDPFKRPSDPIQALQISAVTLNSSEDEIDVNVIAETQPFCFETPESGGDTVRETAELEGQKARVQETAHVEKPKEVSQAVTSQDDTEPISPASRGPVQTGTWLHLRPEPPVSTWGKGVLQESDSAEEIEESAEEEEEPATQPYTLDETETQAYTLNVPRQEIDATDNDVEQPYAGVPAVEADAIQLNMSTAEVEATQSFILNLPSTEGDVSQLWDDKKPCVPGTEEDATQLSMPVTIGDAIEPCTQNVPATEEDATQLSVPATMSEPLQSCVQKVPASEEDATQLIVPAILSEASQPYAPSVPATEGDAVLISKDDMETKMPRRGLCRNKRKAKEEPTESASSVQVASEKEKLSLVTPVESVSSKTEVNTEDLERPSKGQRGLKMKEEEGAERDGRRKTGRRTRGVEEEKNKPKEDERIGSATERKRKKMAAEGEPSTSGAMEEGEKMVAEGEPSTSGAIEEGTFKRASRKSAVVKAVVKETEEENKDVLTSTHEEPVVRSTPEVLVISSAHEVHGVITDELKDKRAENIASEMDGEPTEMERKDNICPTLKDLSSGLESEETTTDINEKGVDLHRESKEMKATSTQQEHKATGQKRGQAKKRVATESKNIRTKEAGPSDRKDNKDVTEKAIEEPSGSRNLRGRKEKEEVKRQPLRRSGLRGGVKEEEEQEAISKTNEEPSKKRTSRKSQGVIETLVDESKKIGDSLERTIEKEEETGSKRAVSRRAEKSLREEDASKKVECVEPPGKRTSRRRKNLSEEEEKKEEEEDHGASEEGAKPGAASRRGRKKLKPEEKEINESVGKEEEKEITEEENEKVAKSEKVVPVRKSRSTKKSLVEEPVEDAVRKPSGVSKATGKQEVEEVEKSQTEEPAKNSRRTRSNSKEVVEEESRVVKQTPRRTRNSSKEDTGKSEQEKEVEQAKKIAPRRSRRNSKEEQVIEETATKEPVGKVTSRRMRKNSKEDEKTQEKTQNEDDSSFVKSTSRTRRKKSTEGETSANVEAKKESSEDGEELTSQEGQPRTGRGRRAAVKKDSTPARKRGQVPKGQGDVVKRKKSTDDTQQGEGDGEAVHTVGIRNQRRRSVANEEEKTENVGSNRKNSTSPLPTTPASTRARSRTVSNSPSETPRRTSRAAGTASPFSGQGPPKVLFTGVVDADGEEIIRSLGGDIAESVFDCTHLVTDRVRRTVKFLCALARGLPIVTLDWIDKCKKSGCFLSHTRFLVKDKEQEKNFKFVLSESLLKAKRRPLFEGYEIHVTPNVKPEPEHMKEIIQCSGATFLPKMPRTFKEKRIIVSCPEDLAKCKVAQGSLPVTTAEFLLSGILRQEAEPQNYLLSAEGDENAPTPAKRRR